MATTVGICRLCGQKRELIESHVWSRFAYKRYVSDRSSGGAFLDLYTGNPNANKQCKRNWFCAPCDGRVLGQHEGPAAEFCDRLEKAPTEVGHYDKSLLYFAVSISLRTAMFFREEERRGDSDCLTKACKHWKDFLRGRRSRVAPYSQHLFVVFDKDDSLHLGLGGDVYPHQQLVLSQIGPLFIVGLLGRSHLSLEEIDVWSHSIILEGGGSIKPISKWRVNSEITLDFAKFLASRANATKHRRDEVNSKDKTARRP
jgi:hypothetical protein